MSTPLFIVGASGLLAAETLRLADGHPQLGPCFAFSRNGQADLRELHPQLAANLPVKGLEEIPASLASALQHGNAALVFATPHGVSKTLWPQLRDQLTNLGANLDSLYVVDLSEDYRCGDHVGEEDEWAYGLPELHRIDPDCRKVAVAGCFATAMQLAILPLHQAGLLAPSTPLLIHGVTASSGSGAVAKQGTHHPYRSSNFHPYALNGHRHEKELLHSRNFQHAPSVVFLPYSAPLGRGIYLTASLTTNAGSDLDLLAQSFQASYQEQPFVQLVGEQAPQLRAVIGSNRAAIGWNLRHGVAQVHVALDNTIKGGAGQGLQCLNLMLGLDQKTGLPLNGLGY